MHAHFQFLAKILKKLRFSRATGARRGHSELCLEVGDVEVRIDEIGRTERVVLDLVVYGSQYLPKGIDLSTYSQFKLNAIARRLNERPRETLNYETPAERFHQSVASTG
jgi:hypothetical protein